MIEGITEEEHKQAVGELAEAVNKFEEALSEAESIANKFGLDFSISPAYAMGGRFYGAGDEDEDKTDEYGDPEFGWSASSNSC